MTEPLVHVIASERHFVDHLEPIWCALPEHVRGQFWTGGIRSQPKPAQAHAEQLGIDARPGLPKGGVGLGLVASSGDLKRSVKSSPHMAVVFTEHGCGLSYDRVQASYAGSPNRPNVTMFLFPNEISAARQRAVHPDRRIEVLGSSPRLDRWHGRPHQPGRPPVVAISFHWDCQVVPETRSALYHYRHRLDELIDQGWTLVGHAHPRLLPHAELIYHKLGIETITEFDDVLERADCYVVDNSSTLYEFAALGRPTVTLNCPRYRRSVSHGLRFWDHVPGVQVDGPGELAGGIRRALEDPPELRKLRDDAVAAVYPRNDGAATQRAVAAILDHLAAQGPVGGPTVREVLYHVVQGPNGEERFTVAGEARRRAKRLGVGVESRAE